jgi:nitroimidazol reductase NimA-like FMN-containing flavoprotein (pyridoxamine 5'-phosphate oxidase superfamily)
MTPQQRAQRLIDESDHMIIATVGADGAPWATPVFYVADQNHDLYWMSEQSSRHSVNIRSTGTAAIVIFEVEPGRPVDGVYISAESAELVEPEEIKTGIEILARKPQPNKWVIQSIDDVTGEAPWRIYRAHPITIEVRANAVENGKAVARRESAEFRASD